MIHTIAGFELRYQLRRPLLWLMLGAFLLIGFASGSSEASTTGIAGGVAGS